MLQALITFEDFLEVFEKKSDGNFVQIWDFSLTATAMPLPARTARSEREGTKN